MGWRRLDRRDGHGEGERLGAFPCGSKAHLSLPEGRPLHLRVAHERLQHVELSGGAEGLACDGVQGVGGGAGGAHQLGGGGG